MKSLDDYLKLMKTDDVVKATQEARTKNALLLNDQGLQNQLQQTEKIRRKKCLTDTTARF